MSLDEVEHEILRPMGEPRIHLALVCASVHCPDLRREPYGAARLDEELDDQGIAHVSSLFAWFAEDFAPMGGVAALVARHRPDLPFRRIAADLSDDWSVNVQETAP